MKKGLKTYGTKTNFTSPSEYLGAAKRGTPLKKKGMTMKKKSMLQYGDKGYKPSNGIGVSY